MKSSIRRGIRHFIYATPVHRWMGLGAAQLGGGDWDRQLAGPLKSYLGGTISVEARNMAVLTLLRIRHPSMVGSHPPHGRIQMAKKVTSYLSVLFCPLRHQTPQYRLGLCCQRRKALPHVGDARRQPDPRIGRNRDHGVRPRISRAKTSGS